MIKRKMSINLDVPEIFFKTERESCQNIREIHVSNHDTYFPQIYQIFNSKNSFFFQIKFLKTKEGAAMIQMGDGMAVERCVQHLNNAPMFNSKNRLQLGYSKQPFLSDVANPFTLPDGSPSFKDFIGNKHNRFINPAMSMKNRIQSPSRVSIKPNFIKLRKTRGFLGKT